MCLQGKYAHIVIGFITSGSSLVTAPLICAVLRDDWALLQLWMLLLWGSCCILQTGNWRGAGKQEKRKDGFWGASFQVHVRILWPLSPEKAMWASMFIPSRLPLFFPACICWYSCANKETGNQMLLQILENLRCFQQAPFIIPTTLYFVTKSQLTVK